MNDDNNYDVDDDDDDDRVGDGDVAEVYDENLAPESFGPQPIDFEPERPFTVPVAPPSFNALGVADFELSPEGQGEESTNFGLRGVYTSDRARPTSYAVGDLKRNINIANKIVSLSC